MALWAAAIAFATACYTLAGGLNGRHIGAVVEEIAIYGSTLTFASAVSVVVTLAIAGKKRLALHAGISFVSLLALLATLFFGFLWLAPFFLRSGMTYWALLELREDWASFAWAATARPAPIGVTLGFFVGTAAGLLTLLGHRWPRLGGCLAVGLLVVCVSSPVQRAVFSQLTDTVLARRYHGNWGSSKELPSALGGTFGAIAGAICAGVAAWKRTRPGERVDKYGELPDSPAQSTPAGHL